MAERPRIAFVKFGGLAAGGTERWLQMMAANLPADRFAVDYFYCDSAPYIGSDFRHPDTDPDRLAYMQRAGVNLVKFTVGAKDVTSPTHDWVETDFWQLFDPRAYDLVQTAKAGPAEYPYHRMSVPVVEYVTLSAGVDKSSSIALSIHLSQWQRRQWAAGGGDLRRSAVIPIPAESPASTLDLREELAIPPPSQVAGFHQRAQDEIFSPIPLEAFGEVFRPNRYFVIMGGGSLYRQQAVDLGLQNVIFLEHRGDADRISRFLNTLDVFAHGRRDGETFGTVLAEAMMHGKPCLSHHSPIANAQPETMGPAGLFATDAEDFAVKLERLLSDPDLRDRLKAKARPHAERYYSLDSCVLQLEHLYEMVLGGSPSRTKRPVSYGQSDLGFLVAGAVENPSSVAHHVVAGGIPEEAVADLLLHLLPFGGSYHEAGTANTILALAAARRAKSHLYVTPSADVDFVRASIGLNNWEDRLSVEVVPAREDLPGDKLRSADVVTINAPDWAAGLVPRMALDESPDRPALLLNLGQEGVAAVTVPLEALGYECRRVRGVRGWFVCLHPAHHASLLAALPAWARHRRRVTRRRIMTLPARTLQPARARAGAHAYRLRRLLLGRRDPRS